MEAFAIHQTQTAIGFSVWLMQRQLLGSWAPQRPMGLESKVGIAKAASFPGRAYGRGSIARDGGLAEPVAQKMASAINWWQTHTE